MVFICVIIITACNTKANLSDKKSGEINSNSQTNAEEKKTNSSQHSIPLPLQEAIRQNRDTVGWLRISGTDIDNPVYQSINNEKYLRLNDSGEYDIWGCYYADLYSNLTAKDNLMQNTVIYGHSEETENPDGKRFSQLFRYLDLDFIKANPVIQLTIGADVLEFEIFAVFFTDIDFYYIDPSPSNQGFDSFIAEVGAKDEYLFEGITITEQDKLLTLSTCATRYDTGKTGNHRLVIMARLTDMKSSVSIRENPTPKRPKT